MSLRHESRTMRPRVPLSVAGSRYVERCYAMHGKSYDGCPSCGSEIELVLISEDRKLWTVEGYFPEPHKYLTDAVGLGGDGWKILGWRMADGSRPLGDHDAVDPELAQIDDLPVPNAPQGRPGARASGSETKKPARGRLRANRCGWSG